MKGKDTGGTAVRRSKWLFVAAFLSLLFISIPACAYQIRHGDTLWDISQRFLQNPFLWPKVWALNPHLQNPHWIYPGGRLRLKQPAAVGAPTQKVPPRIQPRFPVPHPSLKKVKKRPQSVLPFVTFEDIRAAGFIAESKVKEVGRVLTNRDDTPMNSEPGILCFYTRKGEKIRPGDRFTSFTYVTKVNRPGSYFRKIGELVQLGGDIEVTRVEGRFCFAKILHSYEEIGEGDPIGQFPQWPSRLVITPFKKLLNAHIVMMKDGLMMGAQDSVVYIDKGNKDGLRPGNKLHIYKRCPPKRDPYLPSLLPGFHKMELPERCIGSLVVLSTQLHTATTVVYTAQVEIDVGDRVDP